MALPYTGYFAYVDENGDYYIDENLAYYAVYTYNNKKLTLISQFETSVNLISNFYKNLNLNSEFETSLNLNSKLF